MQILESSVIGLRSARITFRCRGSAAEITLFPMVHVGEEAFFQAVYGDAFQHDVVLVEGVSGPIAKRITRSYRWMAKSRELGLVLQSDVKPPNDGAARVVLADLSPEEFAVAWRNVPIWLRVFVYVVGPLVALRRRLFYSRAALARARGMDDLTPDDELVESPDIAALTRAILHTRDKRLLDHLDLELKGEPSAERRVAVIYGAGHMRAVVRHLTSRGYHVAEAEWLTVFSI